MTAPPAAVSVLIVSLDTKEYLARCLEALTRGADAITTEIIVVDNGSTDGTQRLVAERFPTVQVIQSASNVGFGAANNRGARTARGRALLLLNSDCDLRPGALPRMAAELARDSAVGAVFPRLVNADGTLQPSIHGGLPSLAGLVGDVFFLSALRHRVYRTRVLNRWLLRSERRRHAASRDVAWGGAACMLIRREAWDAVGGFDERFFMYWEDVDLCKRLREAGHRLRYIPDAVAVHHWGKSTAQRPASMLREAYRSRVSYFDKHGPGARSTIARWLTSAEIRVRQGALALMASVPSTHRAALRERAAASAACARMLRGTGAR